MGEGGLDRSPGEAAAGLCLHRERREPAASETTAGFLGRG